MASLINQETKADTKAAVNNFDRYEKDFGMAPIILSSLFFKSLNSTHPDSPEAIVNPEV